MNFRIIRLLVFGVVAIGSLFGGLVWNNGSGEGRGMVVVFVGLWASVMVLCFFSYLKKFFLSDILAVTICFGVVGTLMANILTFKGHSLDAYTANLMIALVVFMIIVPIVLYVILERRMPLKDRIGPEKPVVIVVLPPEVRMRRSRSWLIVLSILLVLYAVFWVRFRAYPGIGLILILNGISTQWQIYKRAENEIAAQGDIRDREFIEFESNRLRIESSEANSVDKK